MSKSRKDDHLKLFNHAVTAAHLKDNRFDYEPLLSGHQSEARGYPFLSQKIGYPVMISSMTGGSLQGKKLNAVLATLAATYRLPLALGSIRPLLDSSKNFDDFNLRSIIGSELPFFANIGIAQVEALLEKNESTKLVDAVSWLQATGLIVHINPIQEFLQPEGDRFKASPLQTLLKLMTLHPDLPLAIKEVGHGFGPRSLQELTKLKPLFIDLAGFGGTNFGEIELRRQHSNEKNFKSVTFLGHDSKEMLENIARLNYQGPLVVSGGVETALDAYYYFLLSKEQAVVGLARTFMNYAMLGEKKGLQEAKQFFEVFDFAKCFLRLKNAN